MNQKQIEQYQIRYSLDNYTCQKCKLPATQIGHRIARTKVNYKKYGKEIIDHNMNMCASCSVCNSSFNIGNNPGKCKILSDLIKAQGYLKLQSWIIEGYLNE